MKTIKLFVYALVMCMSFVSVAEAKGRTGSFKSGFSSQKRAAQKPAPASHQTPPENAQVKKTAFGSFGGPSAGLEQKNASVPQSQMSKDLSATATQANALKAVDTRTKANEKLSGAQSESGWFRSGNQNASTQKPSGNTGATAQPENYQAAPQYRGGQQSNGLLHGLIGFMIGSQLAQHANTANVQPQSQSVAVPNDSIAADGAAIQQEQRPSIVEAESFFVKLLRIFIWIALIGGIFWGVRKVLGFRSRKFQATNYSLRS